MGHFILDTLLTGNTENDVPRAHPELLIHSDPVQNENLSRYFLSSNTENDVPQPELITNSGPVQNENFFRQFAFRRSNTLLSGNTGNDVPHPELTITNSDPVQNENLRELVHPHNHRSVSKFSNTMSQQDYMHAVFERLMAQPELLATLAESIQSQKSLGTATTATLQKSPVVQLVSQSVEIIVAPKVDTPSSPRRYATEDRSARDTTKNWSIPVYDVDPEEEKTVNAMRLKELVGKTITGTFFMKDQPPHVKHWIRCNEKKCDNVYIPQDLAFAVFGGQPKSGAKVKCTITALGPETATAWRKHPQCETFEIIPKSYISPMYPRSDISQGRSFRTVASSSSNSSTSDEIDSWMSSRRTTGRSLCPSMVTARSSHLTAFRGNDAKNWRSSKMSMGSMGSIMETEG